MKYLNFSVIVALLGLTLTAQAALPPLASGAKWQTNQKDAEWSSSEAKKGGVFHSYISSFPLTLRPIGPDSNSSFRDVITSNDMGLIDMHPNTLNFIPGLADQWAVEKDGKTVNFHIDPAAKWSDGQPVTADDFLFGLEVMRSKNIVDPWYNNFYTETVEKITKIDNQTIQLTCQKKPQKLLLYYCNVPAWPKHFFNGVIPADYVQKFNWTIVPNTGPYQIAQIDKGKSVTVKRNPNWWAKDKRYYKNRFNVDEIRYTIIRDDNIAYQHFLKGDLDAFAFRVVADWYTKKDDAPFKKGYATRVQFYNDSPQGDVGIWMNLAKEPLNDLNVRIGFSHSMNIEKVIKTVMRGDTSRMQHITTGFGKYSNDTIKAYAFDLKKADEYFNRAGYTQRGPDGIRTKNGKRLTLTITYGNPIMTDRLAILKEDAKKAGLELNLKQIDSQAAFKAIREKQHELAYIGWGASDFPQFWEHYHSENANKPQTNNVCNVVDEKLDVLSKTFDKTDKQDEHEKSSREIQKRVHELALVVPSWYAPFFRQGYWNSWKLPKVAATRRSDSLFQEYGITGGLFWYDEEEHKRVQAAQKAGQDLGEKTVVDKTYFK